MVCRAPERAGVVPNGAPDTHGRVLGSADGELTKKAVVGGLIRRPEPQGFQAFTPGESYRATVSATTPGAGAGCAVAGVAKASMDECTLFATRALWMRFS